uniref:Cyclic nucleotide-binding domain-containing protein n=1 Tax=Anopheles minimus TaxID=112268 RepID=A0A182W7R7_9DIPT
MSSKGHRCSLPAVLRSGDSVTHLPPILPGTTLASRILRHIRTLLLLSPDHPETRIYYRSRTKIAAENARLVRELPPFIIHPFSTFRKCWEMLMYFVLTLHLVTLAFVFAFAPHLPYKALWRIQLFDCVLCAMLGSEFVLKLATGYVSQGEVILEPSRIVRYRLRWWNVANRMLLFVPYVLLLDELVRAFYQDAVAAYLCLVIYLYLLCIWRFRSINWYFGTVARSLFNLSEKQIRYLEPIMDTLHVLHWTSCLLYVVPLLTLSLLGNNQFEASFLVDVLWSHDQHRDAVLYPITHRSRLTLDNNFQEYFQEHLPKSSECGEFIVARLHDVEQNVSVTYRYLRAMMITLKISVQGGHSLSVANDFLHEWTQSLLLLGGWIWSTYILLLLIRTIITSDASETQYDEILNEIDAFCRRMRLGDRISRKMIRHFACHYRMHYFDVRPIRIQASDNLRRTVLMEIAFQPFLARCDVFHDLPPYVLQDIADELRFGIYLEQDTIIEAGSMANSMYFLPVGTAAVYTPDGVELGHLIDGANFGAIALFRKDAKRTVSVVALEVCEVYRLERDSFQKLVKPHSYLLGQLCEEAELLPLDQLLPLKKFCEEEELPLMLLTSRRIVAYKPADDFMRALIAVIRRVPDLMRTLCRRRIAASTAAFIIPKQNNDLSLNAPLVPLKSSIYL